MSVSFGSVFAQVSSANPVRTQGASAVAAQEIDLDKPGAINLGAGERFRITVPLRLSIAVNLGTAQLDVTLARKMKTKTPEEELHLIAVLGVAQASVSAGDKSVTLHGVAPAFAPERSGDYHPSDYRIHFGSGNVTNIGTPDESFIDTVALTDKLQALHIHLGVVAGK